MFFFRHKARLNPSEEKRANLHDEAIFGFDDLMTKSHAIHEKICALGSYSEDINAYRQIHDDLVTLAALLKRHREVQSELKHF
jgi:hypothetical protein